MSERAPQKSLAADTVACTTPQADRIVGPGEVYTQGNNSADEFDEITYPIDTHMGRRIFNVASTGDTSDNPLSCPIEELEARDIYDLEATLKSRELRKIKEQLQTVPPSDHKTLKTLTGREKVLTAFITEMKRIGFVPLPDTATYKSITDTIDLYKKFMHYYDRDLITYDKKRIENTILFLEEELAPFKLNEVNREIEKLTNKRRSLAKPLSDAEGGRLFDLIQEQAALNAKIGDTEN